MEADRKEFMKINYVYVNPGGNPTALVLTKVKRNNQPKVASKLMSKLPLCEQVGFIEGSKNPNVSCRLQMAGGEFCGNALRAVSAWLGNGKNFVESSGSLKSLKVFNKAEGRQIVSGVEIPLNKTFVQNKQIFLNNRIIKTKLIKMDGISFFLVLQKYLNKKEDYLRFFESLYKDKNFNPKACGLVFYKEIKKSKLGIKPIVYVRSIKTLFLETSCSSGSLALALGLNRKNINVLQPSGFVLKIKLEKKLAVIQGRIKEIKQGSAFI